MSVLEGKESEQGTVGGGWLGTYAYKGIFRTQPPVRFEATLTEPDGEGKFEGTILDDCKLGEATVRGGQSGRGIRFTKHYRRQGQGSVFYEGTLADDGRTMQGTWQIADRAHGVWDARRIWSENRAEDVLEETEPLEPERVREVIRLG